MSQPGWYHLALVYNGSILNLYANGALDGSVPATGTISSPQSDRLTIGAYTIESSLVGYLLHGKIDEVSIRQRAMSAEEIRAKMRTRLDVTAESGLLLYLNFDEGTGGVAHDLSGMGNNGTIYGASWGTGVQLDPIAWNPEIDGNGHSYELVRVAAPISWLAAKAQAESMGGHLATITSQAEMTGYGSIMCIPMP
ncbi:MAG: hypothetical protein IPP62_04190 [bacterium]|nr:hypothetical protein [bacterium]